MAGFFGKIKNKVSDIVSITPGARERYEDEYEDDYEGDYEDDYEDDYYDEPYEDSDRLQIHYGSASGRDQRRSGRSDARSRSRSDAGSVRDSSTHSSRRPPPGIDRSPFAGRADIGISDAVRNGLLGPQNESIIMRPKVIEDAVEICQHIRAGRMCIVDLTALNNPHAQRIADYLGGVCHALDGVTTRVNEGIFTVAPQTHRVMSDYRDEGSLDSGFFSKASSDR